MMINENYFPYDMYCNSKNVDNVDNLKKKFIARYDVEIRFLLEGVYVTKPLEQKNLYYF